MVSSGPPEKISLGMNVMRRDFPASGRRGRQKVRAPEARKVAHNSRFQWKPMPARKNYIFSYLNHAGEAFVNKGMSCSFA